MNSKTVRDCEHLRLGPAHKPQDPVTGLQATTDCICNFTLEPFYGYAH